MFKTTVHVDGAINLPASVAEPLYGVELVPFAGLSVVDFHGHVFTDGVSAATHHDHERAEE